MKKKKAGIQCPKCKEKIFSMFRHDFKRCKCGGCFIDGGNDYMRIGADTEIGIENIKTVYLEDR